MSWMSWIFLTFCQPLIWSLLDASTKLWVSDKASCFYIFLLHEVIFCCKYVCVVCYFVISDRSALKFLGSTGVNNVTKHNCFKSGTIQKAEGSQIHLNFVTVLWSWKNSTDKKEALLEQKYFTGSMPLLTPNHSSKTCGSPEPFTSITIVKTCVGPEPFTSTTIVKTCGSPEPFTSTTIF